MLDATYKMSNAWHMAQPTTINKLQKTIFPVNEEEDCHSSEQVKFRQPF